VRLGVRRGPQDEHRLASQCVARSSWGINGSIPRRRPGPMAWDGDAASPAPSMGAPARGGFFDSLHPRLTSAQGAGPVAPGTKITAWPCTSSCHSRLALRDVSHGPRRNRSLGILEASRTKSARSKRRAPYSFYIVLVESSALVEHDDVWALIESFASIPAISSGDRMDAPALRKQGEAHSESPPPWPAPRSGMGSGAPGANSSARPWMSNASTAEHVRCVCVKTPACPGSSKGEHASIGEGHSWP